MHSKPKRQLTSFSVHLIILLSLMSSVFYLPLKASSDDNQLQDKPVARQKIMLALLLDTSNSMDGLIDQAKSQLWTIVNELAAAKCTDGEHPEIKIALFEYGNDGIPAAEGHIRMVVNLTDDLDAISEKLFMLSTKGGDEFCGQVINKSITKLDWTNSKADLKMIFIAGNEPFTQGSINYNTACNLARDKDIVVNSIFCGQYDEGIRTSWKRGADLTGGSYMSIEQNRKTVYINTPYDDKISHLNEALNDTYIFYGSKGREKKEMQKTQDTNAQVYGQSNAVKRAISKSSHVYKNSSWDLVDAAKDDESILEDVKTENLPDNMKSMSLAERKKYVNSQSEKRQAIKSEIQKLNIKRKQYITENQSAKTKEGMLDQVMIQSIKEIAKRKNLVFE